MAAPLMAKKTAERPPHIVIVLADSIGAWTLGCYGNKEIRTPNLDLLARGGTLFTHNVVCAPAVTPSVASLLTGLAPQQHGIGEGPAETGRLTMLSDLLAGAGYNCGFAGHWDFGDASRPRHGFRYWQPQPGFATPAAVGFLDHQKPDQPFFLLVRYPCLRPPYEGHAKEYRDLYASSTFEDLGRMPAAGNAAEGKEHLQDTVTSLRKAAAEISAMDGEIPALIAALDRRKVREETLFVFTAACGHLMGRHGLWGAGRASAPPNMYDEAVLAPMIWNWPGRFPVQGVRPEIVSGDDMLPSLCEATGISAPKGHPLPGRSYIPVATNRPLPRKRQWRNRGFSTLGNTVMVRDPRFKLVLRDGGKGQGEFYDMRRDPREMTNLYEAGEVITMRRSLTREIEEWRKQYR